MKHCGHLVFLLLALAGLSQSAYGVSLIPVDGARLHGDSVEFRGNLAGPDDLSGVVSLGDLLVVVSDEIRHPTVVQVLKKDGSAYRLVTDVKLPAGKGEVDLEAAAAAGGIVYVTGSHSRTRKVGDGDLKKPERKEEREQFFRFRIHPDGTAGSVEGPKSLTPAIKAERVLKPFRKSASKENGIDIEGLAVKNGRLYFGFRAPVLREGWVPILTTTWDDSDKAKLRYVNLDGRGVRDLAAVDDGFLILAGPVGDGNGTYRLYFWNGVDQLTGGADARARSLAEFGDLNGGKPEGLAVLGAHGKTYDILVICDGLANGGAMRWTVSRP